MGILRAHNLGMADQLDRRTARIVGLVGFVVAAALPPILWHRAIAATAMDFRMDIPYLTGGSPTR
jgi:hypothetical protein